MSLRAISRLAPRARSGLAIRTTQNRLMGGGPALPPFKRNLAPTSTLHEEHELVWDDGVAPELTIDFDAQHISSRKGLAMFAGGFLFFLSLFGLVAISDPASKNPALNRTINMIPDPPRAAAEDEEEDDE
ncbi:hypothetical protein TrRE_jg7597 [Triparma retinervis]|uniref:Uncharacterized protein n=1 Tax=Triparma retinervis TaxID=2557542 RepID=A0A9W7E7B2_9STRA|nr:hypothetical protein TrRE_jg7597 [Triparma retinervis]